jgi:hypothetical protein
MEKQSISFAEKYASGILVAVAVVLAGTFFTLDAFDLIPLQGAAMPMYGALPTPSASTQKSVSSRSSHSIKVSSSILHAAAMAQSSSSKSSSSASSKWTGTECASGFSKDCETKVRATLTGDSSCILDFSCHIKMEFCSLGAADCKQIKIAQWFYDSFYPDCATNTTADCKTALTTMLSSTLPADMQTCLGNTMCRELLSTFRTGDFTCRKYVPCLNALDALVAVPTCVSSVWCRNMKTIDALYTQNWSKCPSITGSDCIEKLGMKPYVTTTQRRIDCEEDSDCQDDAAMMASNLVYGRKPECFLWSACKSEFTKNLSWACTLVHREPDCGNSTAVMKFLTVTNPACVTSGDTATCQNALSKLVKLH